MAQPRRQLAFTFVVFTGLGGLFLAPTAFAQGDTWKPLAPMQIPRRLLAAAAEGGKIYTFGGCGSPCFEPPLHTSTLEETRVEVYDPDENAWRVKRPMSAILFGAAAAAPGNGNHKIYTFGGYVTPNLTQEYNPETDTWRKRRSMPTPRHGLAAVAFGGKVYVLGGSDGRGPINALEIYDPATDTWTRGPSMPSARVFLAAAEVNGKIYAIGGSPDCCGKSQTAAVEIYDPDPDENRWTTGASLPVALQTSAAASMNGKIYVFGGFIPGSGVQNTTFEYDPATNVWSTKAPMTTVRDQAPAVAVDGLAYVLGGAVDCHCSALGENERYTPPSVPPPPKANLLVVRKTDGADAVCPGDSVTYEIEVRNEGPSAVTAARIEDDLPSNLKDVHWSCTAQNNATCSAPDSLPLAGSVSLPPNRGARFFVTGTVSGGQTLVNKATIFAPPGIEEINASDDSKTDIDAISRLDLALSVEGKSATCSTLGYTLVVMNKGTAADARITALTPPGLTPATPGDARCRITAGNVVCSLSRVAAGATIKLPLAFEVPECHAGENPIPMSAFLDPDCDTSNDEVSFSLAVDCKADLAASKQGPPVVEPGDSLTYSVEVVNNGPDPACAVVLHDPIPAGLASPDLPSGCDVVGNEVQCKSSKLPPDGSPRSFPLGFTVTAPCGSEIVNAVHVNAGTSDPNENNNSATSKAAVECCHLAISKTDGLTEAMPGDSLSYEITVKNLAKVDAVATVADLFPKELTGVRWCRDAGAPCEPGTPGDLHEVLDLAAGATATYRAQGTVDAMFIGTLLNTATVTAPPDCKSMAMDTTDITCTGVKALCKDISGSFIEGGAITYTFVLLNCGPAIQMDNPGDEFTDTLPTGLTLTGVAASSGTPSFLGNTAMWNGSIAVGEMVTITITATIDAGTAGMTLCNQAMIAFDADGDGVNESAGASDDPNTPVPNDPCCFRVRFPFEIPALSVPGLLALALLLASLALLRLRRRSP